MNDHQTVQLGIYATAVLDNEAFKQAMSTLRAAVVRQWRESDTRDREGQLLLLQMAKLTDKFEAVLVGLVETGKLTKHRLDLDDARNESPVRRAARKVMGR